MATPQAVISSALAALPKPGPTARGRPTLVDLGSGDGRLVIHAAQNGYRGVGYELNWVLVCLSYLKAARAGVLPHVEFRRSDFWQSDLTSVSVVSCFGVRGVMQRLYDKVRDAGACEHRTTPLSVVLFRFPLPDDARHHLDTAKSSTADELFVYSFFKHTSS